jgi:YD repeat-containing protein
VNASNRSQLSQLSGYTADTLADIDNALSAGWTATVPQHPVNLGRFQNVEGYVLENPVNGEGIFRLGSSLNGGEGDDVAAAGASSSPAGCCQPTKSVVMLNDGNWRESRTDLMLPAIGLPIVFSRTYASQATTLTPLGYGWIHSYGMFLRSETNGDFTYVTDDWHEVRFSKLGAAYQAAPGWHFSLTDTTGGGHAMRSKQGIVWEFGATGALTRISEPSGNATTLVYAGDKLIQVKDSSGQVALTLSYTGNKLTSVLDRTGRIVRFGYTNDDLTAATDVLDHIEAYGYDNAHNLTSRTDKRGNQYIEFYDLQDRWVGYRDPLGHEVSVAYDFVNARAVFTDRTGAAWTTEFDAAGNPTARVDPLGNRTDMIWDADSNQVSSKDARGFVTAMAYDSRGNQRTRTEPDGRVVDIAYDASFSAATRVDATGQPRITTVLDAAGRPASRSDGLGTTSFGYDAQG